MNYTKGEWRNWSAPNGYHIWAGDVHIADVGDKEDAEQSANANLIVEVVNACQSVNPDNPFAVAQALKDLYEVCNGIARLEQTAGKTCALCGGYLDHKKNCLFVLAQKALDKVESKDG